MTPDSHLLTEERAREIAERVVDEAGGTREIYRNPRYAFDLQQAANSVVDGVPVELRRGEISSPAVVTVGGYVFVIHDEELQLLIRPRPPKE